MLGVGSLKEGIGWTKLVFRKRDLSGHSDHQVHRDSYEPTYCLIHHADKKSAIL